MSFCTKVKDELCNPKLNKKPCCADAFLTGVLLYAQTFTREKIVLSTDSLTLQERVGSMLKKLTGIEASEVTQATRAGRVFYKLTFHGATVEMLYEAAKHVISSQKDGLLTKKCDCIAFLRGAFCSSGYVFDPEVSYQIEIAAPNEELCEYAVQIAAELGVQMKITVRRGVRNIAYLKGSEEIFDFLNMLGASTAGLRLMETKVIKEVRNDINRRVNFETANLMKTASASAEQIEAIERIERERGLEWLPDHLASLARLRRDNPELSLAQLGQLTNPPLSRSGVNHRLKKIVELSKM